MLDAGRQALARAGVPVGAVGLANQGETVLAWDRSQRTAALAGDLVAGPPRAAPSATRCAARAEWLRSITGLPLDPVLRRAEDALAARAA